MMTKHQRSMRRTRRATAKAFKHGYAAGLAESLVVMTTTGATLEGIRDRMARLVRQAIGDHR